MIAIYIPCLSDTFTPFSLTRFCGFRNYLSSAFGFDRIREKGGISRTCPSKEENDTQNKKPSQVPLRKGLNQEERKETKQRVQQIPPANLTANPSRTHPAGIMNYEPLDIEAQGPQVTVREVRDSLLYV